MLSPTPEEAQYALSELLKSNDLFRVTFFNIILERRLNEKESENRNLAQQVANTQGNGQGDPNLVLSATTEVVTE